MTPRTAPMGKEPRRQCAHCPWRRDVDAARDIPGGYSRAKHRALDRTIAEPGGTAGLVGPVRMMACHETPPGEELPCVGWLAHQLGPGNNLALRLRVMCGEVDAHIKTVGPQRASLAATMRRPRRGGAS